MKRNLIISLFIVIILLLSQYKPILTGYARFFTVNNITVAENASIVVLSGGPFTRIPKALELYQAGYGERLLLTTLQPLNSKFAHLIPTNEEIAQEISKTLAIPATFESVPSLKGGATSTFDEAHDLLAYCTKEKIKHLIIVTDAFHTRRALYAFKKVFRGSNIKIEAAAALNDNHDEENWWRSDLGIAAYLLEPIKFAVYLLSDQNVSFIKND
ncbi:MAG: YdcF family protein [Nitrospinae bacterium]|nr:YdcF family protein [Nitrospinota bacterium]